MKTILVMIALAFASAACSSSTETGGGSKDGGSSSSSSSDQTCQTHHLCVGDACKCTDGPKKDSSCTDDSACVKECEYCN